MGEDGYGQRRAPYAPISALHEFFSRIQGIGLPARVDHNFLRKLNVAANNEWSLLSALKFLGVVDERGVPTSAYPLLQTSDRFKGTLRDLVQEAYDPLFSLGGASMSLEDVRNYFRVSSSPSQAKNAARFFREVCTMAGIPEGAPSVSNGTGGLTKPQSGASSAAESSGQKSDKRLEAKVKLLEKFPSPNGNWSPSDYERVCDRFLAILRNLDGSP